MNRNHTLDWKARHMRKTKLLRRGQAPNCGSDPGFILPMTMVLTLIFSLVAVAVAQYTATSLRYGTTVQAKSERLAAADGGARIGLESIRTKTSACPSSGTTVYSGTLNRQSVSVTCQRTALLAEESAPFAAVITGIGVPSGSPSWLAEGTNVATQPRVVGGNVFLAAPPTALQKPVQMVDGDLWYPANSDGTCTAPGYANVTFKPADERDYNCTTATWDNVKISGGLPALPTVSGNGKATGATNNNGCTVFSPGTYTSPPVIGSGTENFLKPGTYYFDFPNSNSVMSIKNALVIAGVPGTSPTWGGSAEIARTPSTFASPRCGSAIASATGAPAPNTGVTIIFGGNSRIAVDPNGLFEIFAPSKDVINHRMGPSLIALQANAGGYKASTLGATGDPLIDMQEGANNGFVVHGAVWAPTSAIRIGNIAQSANGQFMGGLVVGLLNMQSAASAGNFNMRVFTTPAQRKVVVTAVAGGKTTVKAVALIRSATGSMSVNSWRVL